MRNNVPRPGPRPLPEEVETFSRLVDKHDAALLIVDSVEMASQGGEHRTYNDRATEMQRALRCIHCSHLLIDHVSDEGRRGKELAGKAIGGVMKGNLCRNQWEIKKDQAIGAKQSHVGLYQTKTNHTELLAPLGFRLSFTPGAVSITREDVRESPHLAEATDLAYRIEGLLRKVGARPVKWIAEELAEKEDTVSRALRRGRDTRFKEVVVGAPGVAAQWGFRA